MTEQLSPKHLAFCEEYLKCFNATKAYMAIYPDSSYDSARASSAELLAKDNIKEYITDAIASRVMTSTEVLLRLADLAKSAEKDNDKLRALELIGKSQALFLDRTDITTKGEVLGWNEIKKSGVTVLDKPG